MLRDLLKQGGLAGKDRSQGCLSDSTHLERPPKIPLISLERKHARVCLPPITSDIFRT